MKPALIYQWWNNTDKPVWDDIKNPVLVSIATVRGGDTATAIYVLDQSDKPRDWGSFPRLLNFKVIHTPPKIPLLKNGDVYHQGVGYNLCSRPFDLEWLAGRIREDLMIFCETDIIWLRNVLPLAPVVDKFFFNHFNSGFFYYNKRCPAAIEFIKIWKHLILLGMINDAWRKEILSKYPWPVFQDEACMVYISHTRQDLIQCVHPDDNCFFNPLFEYNPEHDTVKNYHLIGGIWGDNRGRAALLLRQTYERLTVSLPDHEMGMLFGTDYRDHGGRYEFSEMEKVNRLLSRTQGNPSSNRRCHFQMMV